MLTNDLAPALPATRSDVTPAFLTAALRAGGRLDPATEVLDVVREPFAEGIGVCGELTLLQLRYSHGQAAAGEGPAPATIVLKLPHPSEDNRAVCRALRMYEREASFYRQRAHRLDVRTPRCFWSAFDPASGLSALLLEDLSAWTPGCQVAGAEIGRAGHAMDALAAIHADSWEGAPGAGEEWLVSLDSDVNLSMGAMYRATWPAFVDRFGPLLPPGALELGRRIQHSLEHIQHVATAEAPLTVCHGDYRLDNLLFGGRTAAVLDWQLVHRGPAAEDLALFLTQSLPVEVRRLHEHVLIRRWHRALAARLGGLESYPLDLAYLHYRRLSLFTTFYAVVSGGSLDLGNERGRALVSATAVRAFTAALDLEAAEFLP